MTCCYECTYTYCTIFYYYHVMFLFASITSKIPPINILLILFRYYIFIHTYIFTSNFTPVKILKVNIFVPIL